jgi:hypothetical protein
MYYAQLHSRSYGQSIMELLIILNKNKLNMTMVIPVYYFSSSGKNNSLMYVKVHRLRMY